MYWCHSNYITTTTTTAALDFFDCLLGDLQRLGWVTLFKWHQHEVSNLVFVRHAHTVWSCCPPPPGTWRKMVKLISLLDTVAKYMYMKKVFKKCLLCFNPCYCMVTCSMWENGLPNSASTKKKNPVRIMKYWKSPKINLFWSSISLERRASFY